jgi:hypothetical protein
MGVTVSFFFLASFRARSTLIRRKTCDTSLSKLLAVNFRFQSLQLSAVSELHATFLTAWLLVLSGWSAFDSKRGVRGVARVSHAPVPGCCLLCACSEDVFFSVCVFLQFILCNFQTL